MQQVIESGNKKRKKTYIIHHQHHHRRHPGFYSGTFLGEGGSSPQTSEIHPRIQVCSSIKNLVIAVSQWSLTLRPTMRDRQLELKFNVICAVSLFLFGSISSWNCEHLAGNTKISYLRSEKLSASGGLAPSLCPWTSLGAQPRTPSIFSPMPAIFPPKMRCLDKTMGFYVAWVQRTSRWRYSSWNPKHTKTEK